MGGSFARVVAAGVEPQLDKLSLGTSSKQSPWTERVNQAIANGEHVSEGLFASVTRWVCLAKPQDPAEVVCRSRKGFVPERARVVAEIEIDAALLNKTEDGWPTLTRSRSLRCYQRHQLPQSRRAAASLCAKPDTPANKIAARIVCCENPLWKPPSEALCLFVGVSVSLFFLSPPLPSPLSPLSVL